MKASRLYSWLFASAATLLFLTFTLRAGAVEEESPVDRSEAPEDYAPENFVPDDFVPEDQLVDLNLREGEDALRSFLGNQVDVVHKLLKPMIEELSASYGISKEQLSLVAKHLMERISTMDLQQLQEEILKMAASAGIDLASPALVESLMGEASTLVNNTDDV